MGFSVLILGGTSEGRRLALGLAEDRRYRAILSFAGRTQDLRDPGVPHRVGGFGGVDGLVQYLQREAGGALVDATHPFARQMSVHAALAAELTRTPLLRLEVPPWRASPGDRWTVVPDLPAAVAALGAEPRRVFSSIGRLEAAAFQRAPQHDYLLRSIDAFDPGLPRARVLLSRGPFDVAAERALLERERIEIVVSKNSGTAATYAKLIAARELGLKVVLVDRPVLPQVTTVSQVEAALEWLNVLHEASVGSQRGV
jgi:precorrin-6A/cobalt-precorrin-6A reductase